MFNPALINNLHYRFTILKQLCSMVSAYICNAIMFPVISRTAIKLRPECKGFQLHQFNVFIAYGRFLHLVNRLVGSS